MNNLPDEDAVAARARRRLLIWAFALVAMAILSVLWTVSPLRRFVDPETLLSLLQSFGDHPAAIWVILAGFIIGGMVALPVTAMVVLTVAALDPLAGFLFALAGATLSGTISFVIGRVLGHGLVARLAGSRLHRVSLKLRDGGITAIAAVRMMPVTHFTIVSLISGASHIRTRDFLAGTVIGMAPGIGAIALFFESLSAATREPGLRQFAWLAAVSVSIILVLMAFRRRARHHRWRYDDRNRATDVEDSTPAASTSVRDALHR